MRIFSSYQEPSADIDALLRDYAEEITALVELVLAGDTDVDLRLAELVENEQEQVRIAIVERIRALVRARDAEKADALDQVVQQQKMLEMTQKKQVIQQWLAYFMSEETLRKIRESLAMRPSMQQELENIGQDLAKKGVLQQMQASNKKDLGELSANLQQSKGAGRDKGRGGL